VTERATVSSLSIAKVGDMVWVFDSQAPNYGEYRGRGAWKLRPVTGETKQSFIIDRCKFDKKTGAQRDLRGFHETLHAYGEVEKENRVWLSENRLSICKAVERVRDVATLEAIADLIGWQP
jgi:hypothetical protein